MNKKIINGLLFAVVTASGTANAAITTETTVDFNSMVLGAYHGFSSIAPLPDGSCANSDCYVQNGMVVGVIQETPVTGSHVHKNGSTANFTAGYDSDSSGIYMRTLDSTAFSLTSFNFDASPGDENPDANGSYISASTGLLTTGVAGADDYWEILGYSSALNPTLDTDLNSGSWIAQQIVENGFNGTVTLSSAFDNISAFWIHYHGYQQTPADGKAFSMNLDNVNVAAVPVPAAAWMFLSGMMGLLAFGKKKAQLAA